MTARGFVQPSRDIGLPSRRTRRLTTVRRARARATQLSWPATVDQPPGRGKVIRGRANEGVCEVWRPTHIPRPPSHGCFLSLHRMDPELRAVRCVPLPPGGCGLNDVESHPSV